MGIYLNPGNTKFKETIQSQIYVDKSLLIRYTNEIMMTMDKYLCVSRPRRFGKSTDAQMLCAYYGKNCDSNDLFQNLSISAAASYRTHLNQHHVVFLNMQDFLSMTESIKEMISRIEEWVIDELIQVYPAFREEIKLSRFFDKIFAAAQDQFVFIIDDWDCIFREYQNDKDSQKLYLEFLRNLFKDKSYVSLVYMTGILPI